RRSAGRGGPLPARLPAPRARRLRAVREGAGELRPRPRLRDALGFDTSRRDTSGLRRSFDDFSLLIQRYPQSPYAGDARARMIYLRNRLASHELTVVEYYIRRGAFVAAAKRAEQIVAQYPGAPATVRALSLLQESYEALGLPDQAADARKLQQAYLTGAVREKLEEGG
ncbi:MAG: outer membrane protein assembly factor BamD, partial [Gammaproteobacteria bacterium]